jgi:hypothetical protein
MFDESIRRQGCEDRHAEDDWKEFETSEIVFSSERPTNKS